MKSLLFFLSESPINSNYDYKFLAIIIVVLYNELMKHPPVIIVELIHIEGPLKGKIQEFSESEIHIGRHPSCHLCFPSDLTIVSRRHAKIIREGNRFKVVDHNSTNHTYLNGKKVTEAYLKSGDVLMFAKGGPKVSFLTQMKEASVESEPPISPRIRKKAPISINQEEAPMPWQVPPPLPPLKPDIGVNPPIQKVNAPPSKPDIGVNPPIQKVNAPLIIQYGPTLRSFNELPINIGKNPDCDFVLNHPAILEQHARIFFSQNHYWIKDLTGQGLIQVNQKPVSMEVMLNKNDQITFGPQGPFFRFLGEGRLAEEERPPTNEPLSPQYEKYESQRKSQPHGLKEKNTQEGPRSFLDKIKKYIK